MSDVPMIETTINERWTLLLPEHRAVRPEWPVWEKERIASMYEHLSGLVEAGREPVIVDVGAEEGDMPALWASWGCHVVLIEPNPRVWPNIRAIFEANGLDDRMLFWWVGFAGERDQERPPRPLTHPVHRRAGTRWPECAFGPIIGDHGFRHLSQEADYTPVLTLDTLLGGLRVDAITMDVEGSELLVLKGAREALATWHPAVWVSCHSDLQWLDEQYDAVRADDVIAFMDEFGYAATHLASDHEHHWYFR